MLFHFSLLSKSVTARVKLGLSKDETMILCATYRVSVYVLTQCCSGSQKSTFNGNPMATNPCTLLTTAEVLTKKLLTWSRR